MTNNPLQAIAQWRRLRDDVLSNEMKRRLLLSAVLSGLLVAASARASYPINDLDDVIPCFRATVAVMSSGPMAVTNDLVRAQSIVKFEQSLQKHLQEMRSIANTKGDTARIEKIDGIVAQLKKEEELLKALKTLEEAEKRQNKELKATDESAP